MCPRVPLQVDALPGAKEEAEGVVCLAKFLQLEERKALHVMHGFQRELCLRGLASDMDVREYSSLYFYERVRKFYFNERVYLLQNIQVPHKAPDLPPNPPLP